MFHLQEGYINPSSCRMFKIFPVKRLPGLRLPEREVVVSRPLSCPDMPAKRVLSRCICLRRLPALSSPLPHLSSAIFCWQPWNKGLLHIHQTAVKQGSSRKRRSSHLVPAIGLCWFHKHVGLVSSVFPFLFSPQPLKQKPWNSVQSWWEKVFPVICSLPYLFPAWWQKDIYLLEVGRVWMWPS